jgi:hypothetical protein
MLRRDEPGFRLFIEKPGAAEALPFLKGQDCVLCCRPEPPIVVAADEVAELDQPLL